MGSWRGDGIHRVTVKGMSRKIKKIRAAGPESHWSLWKRRKMIPEMTVPGKV